jgi:hypothetical protein
LDFKQPLHQLGQVFHFDFLQGWQDWNADMVGDSHERKLAKSAHIFSVKK